MSNILGAVELIRLIVPISFESGMCLIPANLAPISNDVLYDILSNINWDMININQSISGALPEANVALV